VPFSLFVYLIIHYSKIVFHILSVMKTGYLKMGVEPAPETLYISGVLQTVGSVQHNINIRYVIKSDKIVQVEACCTDSYWQETRKRT